MASGKTKKMKVYLESTISGYATARQFTDALHVAVATVYGMDVLLTWNCTHINNPITLPVVYSEIARAGYKPPKILDARQFMEAYDEH